MFINAQQTIKTLHQFLGHNMKFKKYLNKHKSIYRVYIGFICPGNIKHIQLYGLFLFPDEGKNYKKINKFD